MATLHDPSKGSAPPWKRMIAGSICGVMGAVSCNPFELVKTRLQSSAAGKIAVGHQHNYTGVIQGLSSIYRSDGIKGLYRGALLSMGRSIAGSGSNLAAYSMMKEYLITQRDWVDNAWLDMVAGLTSGVVSCLAMNPIDVVRTRYYNQPYEKGKGVLYSGAGDAVAKIVKNEGFTAFYKGITTHFLRIGPHFCLTFVFLGILRRTIVDFYGYLDRRDSFDVFDVDHNGVLDPEEIRHVLEGVIREKNASAVIGTTVAGVGEDELITAYMNRILDKADVDHDHFISFEEYKDVVAELGKIVGERRAAQERAGKVL
ncbi:hypothetical protein HK097_009615 [Rhizophlyctis rosea]|uniref:EF-hand domain-containing protein n=1 Tax=Rhizophlyctis rosea TaxID=64517 RepID=A0AAD5SBM9_9FUNG|nr:hypothetical protein HK097_009615 [Rhizophlyctis rosea]